MAKAAMNSIEEAGFTPLPAFIAERSAEMPYPPKPYRSDRAARIAYMWHHQTLHIVIPVLAVAIFIGLLLGSDYGPIEILRAKGGL